MASSITGGTFTNVDSAAFGINDSGTVVGGSNHGFVYKGGTFTTLDVPGAGRTTAIGINDSGTVVGVYGNSTTTHGFIATDRPCQTAGATLSDLVTAVMSQATMSDMLPAAPGTGNPSAQAMNWSSLSDDLASLPSSALAFSGNHDTVVHALLNGHG